MPSQTIRELIPGIKDEDLLDDTGEDTIEVDITKNPVAKQSRMFTFIQLHQLFNVQLRRSDVRFRLDENDKATRVLEDKVAELERWRVDLEDRIAKRSSYVDEVFENKQHQINVFKQETKENFDNCATNHQVNN